MGLLKGAGQNIIAIIVDPPHVRVHSFLQNTPVGSFISVVKTIKYDDKYE